ncbi:MAG: hypothetical protein WCK86_16215 [Planctomycetia bacterium]
MKQLVSVQKYFNAGTAESEGNILNDAFVPLADFAEILTPPFASPRLLIGKKGSGKSAFVRSVQTRPKRAQVPALLLKPKDIICNWPAEPASLGDLTRQAERSLLDAIGTVIGSQLSGYLSSEQNELLKLSQEAGIRDQDYIQKALSLLKPIGQAITKVDFDAFSAGLPVTAQKLKTIIESQLTPEGQLLYLFIDDTDQVASPSAPNHLNRIWSLLLAIRFILEECPHIRAIVTLRTEVWKRLSRDGGGQRDQVDHFRNLIYWLNPEDSNIAEILDRRLDLAKRDLGLTITQDHYFPFFEGQSVKIPTSRDEYRSWSDFVVKRSRERPRDAIQMISALVDAAMKSSRETVTNAEVKDAVLAYSTERVEDLEREVSDECPQIKQVIRSFASVSYDESGFKLKAETLRDHLSGIPSRFGLTFMGIVFRPENDRHNAFTLWQFLHEIGFLNARAPDNRMPKGFRHIMMKDDSSLVSAARWNEVQTLLWEVHPAYRDYLINISSEQEQAKAKQMGRSANSSNRRHRRRS